ncbi:hypothetical protein LTR48_002948 [Friedmanniomyces endolithicus]|uniref:Uncharacterized protein n=1 Tax=Rachicladosporium monterosium TaxID=1507873 RepID=A0ABR0L8P8_9PEZI|nr:hypothetical protein LTR48_002948 [Friedmanniomyces endolithicus]KAK5145171.1 hypothetical protein LTR32_003030 [Rachicladosporium monterosium]
MKPKKSKGKVIVPVPENIDQVVRDAYDRGELGAEVYEKLVRAGLHDMREPGVSEWTDTAVAYAEIPPPPLPIDDYVEEYIEVPAPPPSPPIGDSTMDDCQPEEALAREYAAEDALPEVQVAGERPVNGVREVVDMQADKEEGQAAQEKREAAGVEDEERKEQERKGRGFLWCFGCSRVDVVSCRGTPARLWQSKGAIEASIGSSFQNLKLMPQMFEGSEAMQAVWAVAKGAVRMITNDGGVAYRDVDKIVQELGTKDRLASVSLDMFRAGRQDRLVEHLRGGLVSPK